MSIGFRLKEERERLGFTQPEFGGVGGVQKLAQIKYEKGERFPGADYLAAISKLGTDVQYIITGHRSAEALSTDEIELLARFRAAPLAVKSAVIGALLGAAGATQLKKKTQVSAQGGKAAGRDMIIKAKKGTC